MSDILVALISASERAANVARSCSNSSSGDGALLIAEKCEGEANTRFEHDFKTIADVLAQEAAKHEINNRFPCLADSFRGEECSDINGVKIVLKESANLTATLLSSLVTASASQIMADAAHAIIDIESQVKVPDDLPSIDPANLGIWMDPIDGTAEFISGVKKTAKAGRGLPCVTVLIGAYLKETGEPVLGVINQPFFNNGEGRIIWGISYNNVQHWGGSNMQPNVKFNTVLMSAAETADVIEKFKSANWDIVSAPGAGHKLLKVALGEAAAYIVSQGTTFRWDTCAPHAILKAKGGDIISYNMKLPLTYNDSMHLPTQDYCNSDGIIAYANVDVLNTVKSILN